MNKNKRRENIFELKRNFEIWRAYCIEKGVIKKQLNQISKYWSLKNVVLFEYKQYK